MTVLKYFIGIFLLFASIGALVEGSFGSALFVAILGAIILPPVSEWLKSSLNFWNHKAVRYVSYIILFILIVISINTDSVPQAKNSYASEQNSSVQPSNVSPNNSQESFTESENVEENIIGIGQPTEVGNFIYTVEKTTFKKSIGDEFLSQQADGIYLLITLSIKNISNESRTLDNSLFKLTDERGTEYEPSNDGTTALEFSGGNSLFLKQCQPNITTKGTLVFEVPEKGLYNLHLSGGFWDGSTAVIKIN